MQRVLLLRRVTSSLPFPAKVAAAPALASVVCVASQCRLGSSKNDSNVRGGGGDFANTWSPTAYKKHDRPAPRPMKKKQNQRNQNNQRSQRNNNNNSGRRNGISSKENPRQGQSRFGSSKIQKKGNHGNNQRNVGGGRNQQRNQKNGNKPSAKPNTDNKKNQPKKQANNSKKPQQKGGRGQRRPLLKKRAVKVSINKEYLAKSKFSELPDTVVSAATREALAKGRTADIMTSIQALAIPLGCEGADMYASSKPRTGKKLAFAVPVVEKLAKTRTAEDKTIGCLILCPTQESTAGLRSEIDRALHRRPGVSSFFMERTAPTHLIEKLCIKGCGILVTTPEVFLYHLENTKPFADKLKGTKMLVLADAGRMVNAGSVEKLEKIVKSLPTSAEGRQTIVSSARVPSMAMAKFAPVVLAKEFYLVDAKPASEESPAPVKVTELVGEDLHAIAAQVKQNYVMTSAENQVQVVMDIVAAEQAKNPNSKILVSLPNHGLARFYAKVAEEMGMKNVLSNSTSKGSKAIYNEIKGKKPLEGAVTMFSNGHRLRYSAATLVVQVGSTVADGYIHGMVRAGRKGDKAQYSTVLLDSEKKFVEEVAVLKVQAGAAPAAGSVKYAGASLVDAIAKVEDKIKAGAYGGFLGSNYAKLSRTGLAPADLVAQANAFATKALGCATVPAVSAKFAANREQLKDVVGLSVAAEEEKPKVAQDATPAAAAVTPPASQ